MTYRARRGSALVRLVLCLTAGSAALASDQLVLRDGSLVEGEVREVGGNSIELRMSGGSKLLARRDIESARFDETRTSGLLAESDFVIRQDHHRVVGEVTVLSGGQRIQVKLPSGSRIVLPRSDIQRIVRKGDPLHTDTAVYTAELGRAIDQAISALLDAAEEIPGELEVHERLLGSSGIFAIAKVREALAGRESSEPPPAGVAALERVERAYRLKEIMPSPLEEAEPRVYELFGAEYAKDPGDPAVQSSQGRLEAKRDFMLFAFQRFTEESIPLAIFVASDGAEDGILRAWSVEFLRRLQKNRELVTIYDTTTGQAQVAAAIALAQNQILIGVPALIETLELTSPEVRAIAVNTLRSATGMTFGFHPEGAPAARRDSVAQWWKWWEENEKRVHESTLQQISSAESVTPERRLALKIWKEASEHLEAAQYDVAESLLREAAGMDPSFYPARLNLGIVLYAHRDKLDEAIRRLRELTGQSIVGVTFQQQGWAFLHLGHCLRLKGELVDAAEAYRQSVARQPENVESLIALGEVEMELATRPSEGTTGGDRREQLARARRHLARASELLERVSDNLVALRAADLPLVDSLPFDRREYNRSVFSVRKNYRYRNAEVRFDVAKIDGLLGEREKALSETAETLAAVTAEKGDEWVALQASMRTYLGLLYEQSNEPRRALREYLHVLRQLESENAACTQGVERLKRLARSTAGGVSEEGVGN